MAYLTGGRKTAADSVAPKAGLSYPLTAAQRAADAEYAAEHGGQKIKNFEIKSIPMDKEYFTVEVSDPFAECEKRLGFRLLLKGPNGQKWVYPEMTCGKPLIGDKDTSSLDTTLAEWEFYHYQLRMNNRMRRTLLLEWFSKRLEQALKYKAIDMSKVEEQVALQLLREEMPALATSEDDLRSVTLDMLPASAAKRINGKMTLRLYKAIMETIVAKLREWSKDLPEEYQERESEVVIIRQQILHDYFMKHIRQMRATSMNPKVERALWSALRAAGSAEGNLEFEHNEDANVTQKVKDYLTAAKRAIDINQKYPGMVGFESRKRECSPVNNVMLLGEDDPASATCVPTFVADRQPLWEKGLDDAVADWWRKYQSEEDAPAKDKAALIRSYVSPSSKRTTYEAALTKSSKHVPAPKTVGVPSGRSRRAA